MHYAIRRYPEHDEGKTYYAEGLLDKNKRLLLFIPGLQTYCSTPDEEGKGIYSELYEALQTGMQVEEGDTFSVILYDIEYTFAYRGVHIVATNNNAFRAIREEIPVWDA